MPYTVTGRFEDGSAYQVRVTANADRPVAGSARATALVKMHAGEVIPLTPTGPLRAVSGDDEDTVLAVLHRYTSVLESSGAAPEQSSTDA